GSRFSSYRLVEGASPRSAMKAFTPHRTRHLSDCETPCSPSQLSPMYPPSHAPFLAPGAMDHYGALDPHRFSPAPPPDCLMPLNNQLSSSSTFPRINYNSHFDQEFGHPGADSIGGISTGTMGTSVSMGMGLGTGRAAMINSGSATISGAGKMNRLPPNLLDQFEKQLPGQPDNFTTLQFQRSAAVTTSKQQHQQHRTDSPGKIRYLVHSVQKLFAKSQSLENSAIKANMNGRSSRSSNSDDKHHRSKSKDRVKSDAAAKRRPRSNMSGYWSSDDLDGDISNYRNPMAMMTLSRQSIGTGSGQESQVASRYFVQGYSAIGDQNLIKSSKSNSDLKHQPLPALPGPGVGGGVTGGMFDGSFSRTGPWSTLTLGPSRQVYQKGSATLDRTLLKSKSLQQDLGCHYLQVRGRMPSTGEWMGTLGRSGAMGEIPCRRMRSGSYVKAMADLEDSDDSDLSPKPSPKSTARRQSYLRATQQSLSDQFPSRNRLLDFSMLQGDLEALWSPLRSISTLQQIGRSVSCLPSLREFSGNRSLDNLDCIGGSSFSNWDEDDFSQGCSTLGRASCISQVREHYGDELEEFHSHSRCSEAPDMTPPTCFRSRSHSYLRAIQAGCSHDDDSASLDSDSPPPTTTATVRTYSNSTVSTCLTTCRKPAPPPVPPRSTSSKPFISVTVQSSTESAQDNISASSESLESTRLRNTHNIIRNEPQTPAAVVLSPSSTREVQNEPLKKDEEAQVIPVPRRKLSSIGIQVDCLQELQARAESPPPPARFQSIGVQVEDGWEFSRCSSMASRQEMDSDSQDASVTSFSKKNPEKKVMVNCASQSVGHSPPNPSTDSPNNPGSPEPDLDEEEEESLPAPIRQILTNRSSSESLDPALDPSSLPPPDPWLETVGCDGGVTTSTPSCRRDGQWFLKLLQAETGRMEGWCSQMEKETKENQLSEEVLGKVRSAVGSAQLLMSQKFQQFRGLPTAQDLAGFWDLLQLSIEDISLKFDELYQLKSNDWKLDGGSPGKKENQKQAPAVPKKPGKSKPSLVREKSGDSLEKQKQDARKRLMAAKRAQSVKQNTHSLTHTDSTDSVEIYVPEAQTRL
ncbi:hypothetical protein DNTS_007611, partial [Danionella cerebrum]